MLSFKSLAPDPATSPASFCRLSQDHIHYRLEENLRELGDDGVSVGAHSSHSLGNPMSQRQCPGFNGADFPVSALDPVALLPASCACSDRSVTDTPIDVPCWRSFRLRSICCSGVPPASVAVAVAQPAITAAEAMLPMPRRFVFGWGPFHAEAVGVGHPKKTLAGMRRADARSAQICRCNGIAQCFQVSRYSGEPSEARFARNLLAKDDCRSALFDEPVPVGPKMPLVSGALSPAGDAERLARTAPCPNGNGSWPGCTLQCKWPPANSGEGVEGLGGLLDIFDVAKLSAVWNMPRCHEPIEPGHDKGVCVTVAHLH